MCKTPNGMADVPHIFDDVLVRSEGGAVVEGGVYVVPKSQFEYEVAQKGGSL
jgi:hypothetical protein